MENCHQASGEESVVTVKNCTAENKEKAFVGDAEMDNDVLSFGEHMDALPIYERLENAILTQIPDVKTKKEAVGFSDTKGRTK